VFHSQVPFPRRANFRCRADSVEDVAGQSVGVPAARPVRGGTSTGESTVIHSLRQPDWGARASRFYELKSSVPVDDRSRARIESDEITKRCVERQTIVCRQLAESINRSTSGAAAIRKERNVSKKSVEELKPQTASDGWGPRTDLENRDLTGETLSEMCHPAVLSMGCSLVA